MNIEINFSAEIESRLRRLAAAAGTDIGTFVKQIVTERLTGLEPEGEPQQISPDDFARRQTAWVRLFPVLDHAIDDSRESFYAGR